MTDLIIDLPEPASRPVGVVRRDAPEAIAALAGATDARILAGRAGVRPTTASLLRFQADHAVTRDALEREVAPALLDQLDLWTVATEISGGREQYLMRPDLGRCISATGRQEIRERCAPGADLQIVVGDGLSAVAVESNVPILLPAREAAARAAGLALGTPFFIRDARVGVLNDVGDLTGCRVAVLLIGERPGLGRAESLSAYLAYQPRAGHTDAERDVVSNIYARGGLDPVAAAEAIVQLARRMLAAGAGGVRLKLAELP
jgi:ethanolamine ammonia-lyase small subunit